MRTSTRIKTAFAYAKATKEHLRFLSKGRHGQQVRKFHVDEAHRKIKFATTLMKNLKLDKDATAYVYLLAEIASEYKKIHMLSRRLIKKWDGNYGKPKSRIRKI